MADAVLEHDADETSADRDAKAAVRTRVEETIKQWTQGWKDLIETAWKFKEEKFGKDAREAFSFFGSDHGFLFDPQDPRSLTKNKITADVPAGFAMTYNIVAELVQLFGPAIYHRNPNRQCKPVIPLELRREAYVDPMLEYEAGRLKKKAIEFVQSGATQHAQALVAQGMSETDAVKQASAALQQSPEFQQMSQQVAQLEEQIYAQQYRFETATVSQQAKLTRAYTKSDILERLLNYNPEKCDLRTQSRRVVDETLIKGQGVWWTSLKTTPDGKQTVAGSFYKSIDHYLIDPDVENEEDALWVGERCIDPIWKFEDDRGYERGSVKGNLCSYAADRGKGNGDAWHPSEYGAPATEGQTNDLIVYWRLYSKMGAGSRLRNVPDEAREVFDQFGDYCFLEITQHLDHPANLKLDDIFTKPAEEAFYDLQWPTPFWKIDQWPCTTLAFHWVAGSPYGMSHVKPGLGELKFLDWAISHLARKMEHACDDILGVIAGAGKEIKAQLSARSPSGYKVVEIEQHFGKSVAEIFSAIQMPPFHGDIWNVIAAVAQRLDKRLGLTELAYGLASTQSRSALDSQFKQQQFSIRPDDMASLVEERASKLAMKEAYASAFHLEAQDVLPALGDAATELYVELIAKDDPVNVIRQFDYTIEANSIRRPNKERDVENMNLTTQVFLPVIANYCGTTNNWGPLNWFVREFGKAYERDVTGLQFTPPQPPPQPEPSPAQIESMRLQERTAQATLLAALQQAENLRLQLQVKQIELQASANAADLKVVEQIQKLRQNSQEHSQKMQQRAEEASLEMVLDEEEHDQEMRQDREEFAVTGSNNGKRSYQ